MLVSTAPGSGGVGFLGSGGIEMPDALMGRCAAGASVRRFLVRRTCRTGAAAAGGCEVGFRSSGSQGRLTKRGRRCRNGKMVRI